MTRKVLLILFLVSAIWVNAQIPKSGAYTYHISFAEHPGMTGEKCEVIIEGDHVKVVYLGNAISGHRNRGLFRRAACN